MEYVIVGAGPAAMSAAATLAHVDGRSRIAVLSAENVRPYSRMALPYLLPDATGTKNFYLPEPAGVRLLLGQKAVSIDAARCEAMTEPGKKFRYDRLLIATGAVAERPTIRGADLPFVFTVRDYPDIEGIRKLYIGRRGHAVIAGAGPVGMEIGDILQKLGVKVTFVVSSNRVFSMMLDEDASKVVEGRIRAKGVDILKNDDITAIEPDGTVLLRSGVSLKADMVIFGKGVRPAVDFLRGSGIAVGKGIAVDSGQMTNVEGVFAAGDAAETRDILSGEIRLNALWPEAVAQGRVAALNMAGISATYPGSLARNVMRVFDVSIFVAGDGRATGPDVLCDETGGAYRKLVIDEGVLKGAIFIAEVPYPGLYTRLMRDGTDVSLFAPSLLKGGFGYPRLMRERARMA